MKIGIACNGVVNRGGMERYAVDLIRGLNRVGIEPVVFARSFDRALLDELRLQPHRIAVSALPGKLRDHYMSARVSLLRRQLGVDRLIGINRTACADIAICGGTHRGFLQASGRVAGLADRWQIKLESAQYRHAGKVVAHSDMMREELVRLYGIVPEKIVVNYPPVDTARFSPVSDGERARLREQLGFADDQVVFVFPSSSHHRKGYELLAECFEDSGLPLLLAVAGRPVATRSQRVRYIGYQAQIADVYRAADYAILASSYEPFGLVGIESVLCGTPVILDARIGATEVLDAEQCLRFDRRDRATLQTALSQAVAATLAAREKLARHRPALAPRLGYDPSVLTHVQALLDLLEAEPANRLGLA